MSGSPDRFGSRRQRRLVSAVTSFAAVAAAGIVLTGTMGTPTEAESVRRLQDETEITPGEALEKARAEMDRVYRQILDAYGGDEAFVDRLKAAQTAWERFRDAHLEARFPGDDKRAEFGSVYPVCAARILTDLTEARTRQLRAWLDGVEEGDVCAGSIRNLEALPSDTPKSNGEAMP